jgi:hypothetical protein
MGYKMPFLAYHTLTARCLGTGLFYILRLLIFHLSYCHIGAGTRNNGARINCPLLGNDLITSFGDTE